MSNRKKLKYRRCWPILYLTRDLIVTFLLGKTENQGSILNHVGRYCFVQFIMFREIFKYFTVITYTLHNKRAFCNEILCRAVFPSEILDLWSCRYECSLYVLITSLHGLRLNQGNIVTIGTNTAFTIKYKMYSWSLY